MGNVHPTAVVDSSAKVDPAAIVGPYVVIGPDVVIGAGSAIGAHAVVEFTHMGRENRIFPGAYLGGAPQDLKYEGEPTRLVMGDKNVVREAVTLNRGTKATGVTRIGSECLFMANSHVAHDCVIGDGVVLVNSVGVAGHVEIGDHTVVGGLVGIHQWTRIGRYCMLGGGSMIGKDIPHFCTCQGDRAKLRGLNLLGLRRAGVPRETTRAIQEAYKILFLSGLPLKDALGQLKGAASVSEVREMISFIEGSKRGVMRPPASSPALEEEEAVF